MKILQAHRDRTKPMDKGVVTTGTDTSGAAADTGPGPVSSVGRENNTTLEFFYSVTLSLKNGSEIKTFAE